MNLLVLEKHQVADLEYFGTSCKLAPVGVIDALGKKVLEQAIPKLQTETFISVGDLAAGLYQVQLLNVNSGIVGRASLIKQ